jgi:hypothetical protein
MDKPETKANEEWTSQRQRKTKKGKAWHVHSTFAFVSVLSILHLPLSLAFPFFICLCLWLVHSSFSFVSGLSILHLALSLACPFFICLCLSFVHSSFAFVSGLSILHLPLSLACPFLKPETKSNEGWTSQRQRKMRNGQARDKDK